MTTRTIDRIIAERALDAGDECFLRFAGRDLSYREVDRETTRLAHGFADTGIAERDIVSVLLPTCAEYTLTWFALARLGAVSAPVNTAFRGSVLAHVLNLTESRVLVIDSSLCDAIEPLLGELTHLRTLIIRGVARDHQFQFADLHVVAFEDVATEELSPIEAGHTESDLAMLLFTSGTTGRSKGCEISHRYIMRHAELMVEHLGLRDDDVLYCPFPLFHLDATVLTVAPALVLGATAALGERFSVSGFWDEVRAFGATVFDFMGATLTMLWKQPTRPSDADNPVRLAWGVPLPDFAPDFESRFGIRLTELYGLTDAGVPMYEPLDAPRRPGSCGKAIHAFDVQLADPLGFEVPTGTIGEILLRPREPSLLADGYFGMPQETLAARKNLWFHTGDLAYRDDDGYYYFAGRQKDVIRRRGENISALEVEEAVERHPSILEAAAYGVPSELSEDDLMVAVVPRPGAAIDPSELIAFCAQQMARYMVPRYIEVLEVLPKTPTEKVEKFRLVEAGLSSSTWDAEAVRGA